MNPRQTAGRPYAGFSSEALETRLLLTAGDLDTAFRGGLFADAWMTSISDLAVQDDGKVVALGHRGQVVFDAPGGMQAALSRYNPDGALDKSFGDGGRVIIATSLDGAGHRLSILDNGDILIAGTASANYSSADLLLARLNGDGSFDKTFGEGGQVILDVADATSAESSDDTPIDLEPLPTGDFLVGFHEWAIGRFNRDGSLDQSFGKNGILRNRPYDGHFLFDLLPLPSGEFLGAGAWGVAESINGSSHWLEGGFDSRLVRYDADGTPDSAFGRDGIAEVAFSEGRSEHSVSYFGEPHAPITRLLLQEDGRIIAAGYEFSDLAAARYTADGRLDPTFTAPERFVRREGDHVLDYGNGYVDAFLQDDGGVILTASSFSHPDSTARGLALARLKPGGSLDDSFGDGGIAIRGLAPTAGAGPVWIRATALYGDKRILAAGPFDSDGRLGTDRAAVARVRLGDTDKPPAEPPTEPPPGPTPIDADAPRARLKRTGIQQRSARARFRIIFSDDSAIDASSLGDGDILVSARGGFEADARLDRVLIQSGGRRVVGIFSFPAPGGSWDRRDSRLYSFHLAQDAVADSLDNATDESLIRHRRLEFA
jgi:uncharacterized delta-60 repeat protein